MITSKTSSNRVSIMKINKMYEVQNCIKQGIESIDGLNLTQESAIIIKPNLCCIKTSETGATTDVKVVEALINYLKETFGVYDITIVESDASQVLADMAFKLLGYEKMAKRMGVKLVNLSTCPSSIKEYPKNVALKKVAIPKVFEDADFFISVPKIKTHIDCLLTCALKNQFGCNPYPRKFKYHKRLDDVIVDLNHVFRPDLVVVDGIVAMEGYRGPTDGFPLKLNTLIFGRDPVAIDHLVARIMCLNQNTVSHVSEAARRGLGNTDYEVIGVDIKDIATKFNFNRPRLSNFYGIFCKN